MLAPANKLSPGRWTCQALADSHAHRNCREKPIFRHAFTSSLTVQLDDKCRASRTCALDSVSVNAAVVVQDCLLRGAGSV
jgi:hypothetical protein